MNLLRKLKRKIVTKKVSMNKLEGFNNTSTNNISSNNVCLKAIKGNYIQVREHTTIDSESCIGSYTYIGSNTNITKASIGRYCSIANNVSIGPGEHDLKEISTSSIFLDSEFERLTNGICKLGNDVWVGVDSIVRRGVTIGNGAVIGANSFVTKDVPPYAIVAGSPAKIIKYRFNESIINIITESAWWNLELDEAKAVHQKLKSKIKQLDA